MKILNRCWVLAGLLSLTSIVNATEIVNLTVSESGMHRITYEQLQAQGVDLLGVRHNRLALSRAGTSIAVLSKGQDSTDKQVRRFFGPGAYLEFHAEAVENLYSDRTAYTLHIDRKLRRNMGTVSAKRYRNSVTNEVSYVKSQTVEENNYYDFLAPSTTDPWHYGQFIAAGGATGALHEFQLSNLVSGPMSISAEVYGIVDIDAPGNDHEVAFEVNGGLAGGKQFDGSKAEIIDLPTEGNSLQLADGTNTLRMNLVGIADMPFDAVGLNKFVVSHMAATIAEENLLQGRFTSGQYQLSGFDNSSVRVFINQAGQWKRLKKVRRKELAANSFAARFALEPALGEVHLIAVAEGGYLVPEVAMLEDQQNITAGSADYLIVAHPDFMGAELAAFAQYRAQSSSLTTKIVDVTQVYSQFGEHVADAAAIKKYIQYAANNLGVRYVLLVGGDQYDYKNYKSNAVSHVPTLYATTPGGLLLIRQNPVDSLYGDIDGDNVPDLAVGRLPVRTANELSEVLAKIQKYETGQQSFLSDAVIAADIDDNGNGISFEDEGESLISLMPQAWQDTVARVYPQSDGAGAAKIALQGHFEGGARLVSYVGHSAEQVWSRSTPQLLTANEVSSLNNIDKPAVVTQWGCWNTYFVKPESNSMSQAFMLSGNRGAATILGASSLTSLTSERALSSRLVPLLLTPGMSIGDAVVAAKQDLAAGSPGALDVLLGWQILGDPALVISSE